ncbi:hypothetical protein KFK09_007089 [Dendrobium nobile]|uniref:Uncharacterized protein n=1 Tax=Dendrobium nobile TaxID=94219 RepID=A0A8T3BQZ0_DENNO|nr:hypothetical protein KFK09_007089 [Dendrobium nobile]
MASASLSTKAQSPVLKAYMKAPEGRYTLQYEKIHPASLLQYSHAKTISQLTIADLKEKSVAQTVTTLPAATSASSTRTVASRLLGGAGSGARALSFSGGNGTGKAACVGGKIGGSVPTTSGWTSYSSNSDYYERGTYLVFNAGDTLYISDLNSPDKDPIKSIHFGNSNPMCHAFDSKSGGHDLLIGLQNGDIYSVSFRQQLHDAGKKLIGAQHYNKDGVMTNSQCTCVAWVPDGDGVFVAGHADGSIYVYEKGKDVTADCSFPSVKDQTQFSVAHSRSSKSNPIARWHISQGSINNLSFSTNGYLATVGRDGYLRVFDFANEKLICGGKSYYGALLCCAWSLDGKYLLSGGEDDLVQVWSMEERKLVAWGEGHNSWVSAVAFDLHWPAPDSDETGENVVYRFASVGQDTQMLLWDLALEEIAVPLRCRTDGSPTLSSGGPPAHRDNIYSPETLQPSPSLRDVPKLSPVVAHRIHAEPLSGVIFTNESVLTICREGLIKMWIRPGRQNDEDQSATSDTAEFKDLPLFTSLSSTNSSFQQPAILLQ